MDLFLNKLALGCLQTIFIMRRQIFKFNIKKQAEIDLAVEKAVAVLKKGGIVVHPTDTCYGIAADMSSKRAINKVYKFKGRDFNNPFFIIVKDINQFKQYGSWNKLAQEMIKQDPGKMFTFVVSRKKTVPNYLNPDFPTVGIQTPKNRFSLTLLKKFGSPVIGTSANIFSQPVVYSIKDLLTQLKKAGRYPDLILDGGRLPHKRPSSVVAIKGKNIKILR